MRIVQVKDGEAPAPSPPKSAKSASKSVRAIKDFASSSMGLKSGKGSFAAVSKGELRKGAGSRRALYQCIPRVGPLLGITRD